MASCRVTSVVRPAQYKSSRSDGSRAPIAEQYVRMSPEPTARPATRSSWEKSTSTPTKAARSDTGRNLFQVLSHDVEVVAFLHDGAQGVRRDRYVQIGLAEEIDHAHPVDRLGDTGRLGQVELAQPVHGGDDLARECRRYPGRPDSDDLHLTFGWRIADPVVEAAALQGIVQLAGPVRCEDDQRRALGLDRADFRDAALKIREHLQQECPEFVVCSGHLVDQQHRLIAGPDRRQQRPLQQELRAEQLVDRRVIGDLVLGQRPDLQHLAGVVPFIERLVGVDTFVALEPDQLSVQDRGQHLGDLGLAYSDLALKQDRAMQRQPDEQCSRQPAIGEVSALAQKLGELANGVRHVHPVLSSPLQPRYWRPSAEPRTRSLMLAASGLSLPSRCSLARHALRRSPSASVSARPSKPTSFMFLQDFAVPNVSARSVLLWPWALHTPRSTSRGSSDCRLI